MNGGRQHLIVTQVDREGWDPVFDCMHEWTDTRLFVVEADGDLYEVPVTCYVAARLALMGVDV